MNDKFSNLRFNLGFTLIEFIITIIIIGVLSVTVLPKLFGPSLHDSYTARDSVLTALRTMQLRAMQMTAAQPCHKLIISTNLIAPASPLTAASTCGNTADASGNTDYLVVELDASRTDIIFTALDSSGATFNQIQFDSFGRPSLFDAAGNNNKSCATGCRIDAGEADICIASEGLIYGCQ